MMYYVLNKKLISFQIYLKSIFFPTPTFVFCAPFLPLRRPIAFFYLIILPPESSFANLQSLISNLLLFRMAFSAFQQLKQDFLLHNIF